MRRQLNQKQNSAWKRDRIRWKDMTMRLNNEVKNNVKKLDLSDEDQDRINVFLDIKSKITQDLSEQLISRINKGKSELSYIEFLNIRRGKSSTEPSTIAKILSDDLDEIQSQNN